MCRSQCHGSPGQHRCGTKVFKSCAEICCHGHRHEREENVNCCGVCSYNINVPHVRCCCGTLYNLQSFCTKAVDAECCGFVLLTPEGGVFTADQKVWCSGAQQLLLYLTKARFRCCSQKCCNLCNHGVTKHQQDKNDQDSRFLSVDNLNEAELCGEIYVGTVESVFLYSVVFKSVLKIHGRNGTVAPLHNILPVPHRCDPFKLIPGSTHFFNEANVIIDFNHRSVIQALHFVFSKCFHS